MTRGGRFAPISGVGDFHNHANPVILDLRSEAEECRGSMPER